LKNPGFEWRGAWQPTSDKQRAEIEVYKVVPVDVENVSPDHKLMLDKL
jgi:hypothetical protein